MLRKDEASAIAISRAQEKRTDARQETDSSKLTTDHIPQTTNHKPSNHQTARLQGQRRCFLSPWYPPTLPLCLRPSLSSPYLILPVGR